MTCSKLNTVSTHSLRKRSTVSSVWGAWSACSCEWSTVSCRACVLLFYTACLVSTETLFFSLQSWFDTQPLAASLNEWNTLQSTTPILLLCPFTHSCWPQRCYHHRACSIARSAHGTSCVQRASVCVKCRCALVSRVRVGYSQPAIRPLFIFKHPLLLACRGEN